MDTGAAPAPSRALAAFWDRYAHSVGDRDFQWIDVTLAAMVRGDWSPFERGLAHGLACVRRADAERWSDQDAVEAAATAFRYERDLISGDDMDHWLHRVGLTLDEWAAFLKRSVLRRVWAGELDDLLDRYPPAPRDLLGAAYAEGVCSDTFRRLERTFAGHASLVLDRDPDAFARALDNPRGDDARAARLAQLHADWLGLRPPADTAARFARIIALEDACSDQCGLIAAPDKLAPVVDANRLEWTELDLDRVSFATAAAAQEGIYCIREDGLPLAEVAALSHETLVTESVLIDELGADLRDAIMCAEPGDPVGPISLSDRFEVIVLAARRAPSLDSVRVAARARQTLIDAALAQAARLYVTRHGVNGRLRQH
jgi:hypothetical protein